MSERQWRVLKRHPIKPGGWTCARCSLWRSKAFSALRNMGHRESEARLGIERAAARVGASADVAVLLKQALLELTENIGKGVRRR